MIATDLRLPSIRFEAPPARVGDELPRMDVALFAGFAESGPIGVPVAIEQAEEFDAVFGGDLDVAWDRERGETVQAQLRPAVRLFFRNEGRRCWIVRIADPQQARTNSFPLPRLAVWRTTSAAPDAAVARARSEGSWSDALEAGTEVTARPLALAANGTLQISGPDLWFEIAPASACEVGDAVRLSWADGVVATGAIGSLTPSEGDRLRVGLTAVRWLQRAATVSTCTSVTFAAPDGSPVTRVAGAGPPDPEADRKAHAAVDIAFGKDDEILPGTVVRAIAPSAEWLLSAESIAALDEGSPPPMWRVRGPAWRLLTAPPSANPRFTAERLRMTLIVRRQGREVARMEDLALSSLHDRYWGRLPSDKDVFAPLADAPPGALPPTARAQAINRFALAGNPLPGDATELAIPLGDSPFPVFLAPYESALSVAERNGLTTFDPSLFLDQRLADAGADALGSRADFIRYQSAAHPQALDGIYSAYYIDEISIVAVPDAVHRAWRVDDATDPGTGSPPVGVKAPKAPCAPEGPFDECRPCSLAAPMPTAALVERNIRLSWPSDPTDASHETTYTIEEAVGPSFAPWLVVAETRGSEITLYGRAPAEYLYRVTARRGASESPASSPIPVYVSPGQRAVVNPGAGPSAQLPIIHRAVMRMCASRADAIAVLTLPEHYREGDALTHARALASSYADERALSYAAIYHPWVYVTSDSGEVQRMTPDGVACGVLARRALERGAWVAPAAEPMSGVVALAPPVEEARLLDLQAGRVNVIRQQPRGFMVLDEDTLSRDPDLRRINVRRLLVLLRRRALQVGATYVFEPNDDGFRRLVQRAFEATLGDLHARGAFAGATRATAFQVITDEGLNTPQARDAGRFFVELRVAPSRPLTFLTIRLLQRGDQLVASEGR